MGAIRKKKNKHVGCTVLENQVGYRVRELHVIIWISEFLRQVQSPRVLPKTRLVELCRIEADVYEALSDKYIEREKNDGSDFQSKAKLKYSLKSFSQCQISRKYYISLEIYINELN